MEWMLMPLKRYAQFSGRSRRMEFWMYQLMNMIVIAVLYVTILSGGGLSALMAGAAANRGLDQPDLSQVSIGPMFWIGILLLCVWGLGTFIPSLAVTVRRLHDRDLSGWWILGFVLMAFVLTLVPLIGPLLVFAGEIGYIVLLALPGTSGPNRYGSDPLVDIDPEVFA